MQSLTGETGRDDPQFQKMLRLIQGVPTGEDEGAPGFVEIEKLLDKPHNTGMSDPLTRPELDAKLETIEAKMDGRLARIEDRFASIDRQFSDVRAILTEQKNTAWKAAGAVIGVFVAVFAIYVASFDSGRDTARIAADAQQQTAAALTQIHQIVSELKAAQPQSK